MPAVQGGDAIPPQGHPASSQCKPPTVTLCRRGSHSARTGKQVRSPSSSLHWVALTLGRALHFVTVSRKGPFWQVSLVAPPKSPASPHSLRTEGVLAPRWLSKGTELRPELVGHQHMLLCQEHSTLLSCIAPACRCGCSGTGVTGTGVTRLHWSPMHMGAWTWGKQLCPILACWALIPVLVSEVTLLALSEQQGIAGQTPDFSKIIETVLCFNCLMLGLLHTAGAGWPAGGWQTHGR